MQQRICVITGATNGIGFETAKGLALRGFEICLIGRDEDKCKRACEQIRQVSLHKKVSYVVADLSLMSSTWQAVAEIKRRYDVIDVLINNAGIASDRYRKTAEGVEFVYATNHLSHVLLTKELLPLLKQAEDARIIFVSSRLHLNGHYEKDNPMLEKVSRYAMKSYSQSKLLNVMMAIEFGEREHLNFKLATLALHPGGVNTNIFSGLKNPLIRLLMIFVRPFILTAEQGAQTSIFVATAPELRGIKGKYFDNKKEAPINPEAKDDKLRKAAWDYTMELIKNGRASTPPHHVLDEDKTELDTKPRPKYQEKTEPKK